MVRVEMLTVGKELLIGRTLNTNAHWVGGRLARMGTMLGRITTVDDDLDEIESAFRESVERSPDFLIVVGGLGPTPDDMTLKGLARGMGVGLETDRRAVALIREHYALRGLQGVRLTPARRKMALLPRGSVPLPNESGTAPGVRMKTGGTVVFSLPGVPREMKSIFRRSVQPEVRAKVGKLHRKYLRMKVEGVFESTLAPWIEKELKSHPGAYIKSHPRGTKEGVSRMELDIAVVGIDPGSVDREGEAIAADLVRAAKKLGGAVSPSGGD